MTTTQEATAETSRLEYWNDFAEDIAAIDDLADHLKNSSNTASPTWIPARVIRLWPQAIKKTLEEYDGTGVSAHTITIANDILNTGAVDGVRIDVEPHVAKIAGWREGEEAPDLSVRPIDAVTAYNRRLFFAHHVLGAPADFAVLHENEVFAFHGTKGVALPSIVAQKAILSHHMLDKHNIPIGTGQPNHIPIRRDTVSFAAPQERIAINHSQIDLYHEGRSLFDHYEGYDLRQEELKEFQKLVDRCAKVGNEFLKMADIKRFGILLGLSRQALWMGGVDPQLGERLVVPTDFPEYTFQSEVPTTYVPVVAAPIQRNGPVRRDEIERFLEQKGSDMKIISMRGIERAQDMMRRPV